jgi:hypothetical protein
VLRDAEVRDAQIAYFGHGLATPPTAVARLQF